MQTFCNILKAYPRSANFPTDTDTHPLNDIGDTWYTLSFWYNRHKEGDDSLTQWMNQIIMMVFKGSPQQAQWVY